MFVLSLDCLFQYHVLGPHLKRDRWFQGKVRCTRLVNENGLSCLAQVFVIVATVIDVFVALALEGHFRVTRVLRAYFLVAYSIDTKNQAIQVFKTVIAMVAQHR